MSMFSIFNVSGSAISAQAQRLNVVASNLANVDAVAGPDGQAYKARQVVFQTALMGSDASAGVRVNGIAPGLIRTPLNAGLLDAAKIRHYEKKILLGRLGEPDDCAGAVVFLLSPAARYITGQILVVDGGLTLGQIGRM